MRTKTPQPVAFCWYAGREISRRDIERKGCTDPAKQVDGICKHLQWYGKKVRGRVVLEKFGRDEEIGKVVPVREMWCRT